MKIDIKKYKELIESLKLRRGLKVERLEEVLGLNTTSLNSEED